VLDEAVRLFTVADAASAQHSASGTRHAFTADTSNRAAPGFTRHAAQGLQRSASAIEQEEATLI
jgi:aerotaxis receptor